MVLSRLLPGAFATCAAAVNAQLPAPSLPPGSGPKLSYQSVFADYRPLAGLEILPWKRTNDEVAALRGHMGHMAPDAAPASGRKPDPAPALKPAPSGPGGNPR